MPYGTIGSFHAGKPAAAEPPAGAWTTVYTWDTGGGLANDNGNNGLTFVFTIPLAAFSQTGGTRIRLTFDGNPTEGFIASAMYVGNGGGGDAYDFGDTPVQVLMGGGGTITVGAGASGVVTDDMAFVKDGTNPFVMALQLQDGTHDNLWRNATPSAAGEFSYFKSGQDAATQNKTGYSNNLAASYIAKIELFI